MTPMNTIIRKLNRSESGTLTADSMLRTSVSVRTDPGLRGVPLRHRRGACFVTLLRRRLDAGYVDLEDADDEPVVLLFLDFQFTFDDQLVGIITDRLPGRGLADDRV